MSYDTYPHKLGQTGQKRFHFTTKITSHKISIPFSCQYYQCYLPLRYVVNI